MRLLELITPNEVTTKVKKPFDFDTAHSIKKLDFDSHVDKKQGYGSYAYGHDDEDPHLYNKVHYFPSKLKVDPYYVWVNTIKPYIDSNPYLPRVYLIDLEKHTDGKIRPKYKMEKLHTYSNFSTDAIIGLANRLFKENEFVHNDIYYAEKPDDAFEGIIRLIKIILYRGKWNLIKDPLLKHALMLVNKVLRTNSNFAYDISMENVLLRSGSGGLQLVLADPLWDTNRGSQQLREVYNTDQNEVEIDASKFPDIRQARLDRIEALAKASKDIGLNQPKDIGASYKKVDNIDPFMFKKQKHLFDLGREDPFVVYVKEFLKHDPTKSNPFFPRVYSIKTERFGKYTRPTIELEKLYHYDEVDQYMLIELGRRYFDNFDQVCKEEGLTPGKAIAHCLTYNHISTIADKNLVSALTLINNILDNHTDFFLDIHEYNIMYRIGKQGLRLVLSDPISD